MDGIQPRTAEMLLGEFGTDLSRFPSDTRFAKADKSTFIRSGRARQGG